MLTKQQIRALRAAIRRLVKAEVDDVFSGAGDPVDIRGIEYELKLAKQGLNRLLHKLTTSSPL